MHPMHNGWQLLVGGLSLIGFMGFGWLCGIYEQMYKMRYRSGLLALNSGKMGAIVGGGIRWCLRPGNAGPKGIRVAALRLIEMEACQGRGHQAPRPLPRHPHPSSLFSNEHKVGSKQAIVRNI